MMKRLTILLPLAIAATITLSACSSPEPHYYTLTTSPSDLKTGEIRRAIQADTQIWIEVLPVRVPAYLNSSEMVVRGNTTGRVTRYNFSNWASPLPEELRDALSQQLQMSLEAIDVYKHGLSPAHPAFRVTTEVIYLDVDVGKHATATIVWTVRRLPDGKVLSGRTQAEVSAPGQVDGVVTAYRAILARTAADISDGVRSLNP